MNNYIKDVRINQTGYEQLVVLTLETTADDDDHPAFSGVMPKKLAEYIRQLIDVDLARGGD